MNSAHAIHWWSVVIAALLSTGIAGAQDKDDENELNDLLGGALINADPLSASPILASPSNLGATPGGAQDIDWFRDRVRDGEVPHPNTFTPEGLFSEHDLPLPRNRKCKQMLCVTGQAVPTRLIVQEDVRYLAQLGFSSSLTQKTFKRAPLNLIAVVDTSGSMAGEPLTTVRESLNQVASQLRPGDQLAIVRYSNQVEEVLAPTSATRQDKISLAIASLVSSGSTYMEAGLKLGYEVARRSSRGFKGLTRVMLFTDERPNVGRTEAGSFMGMAARASKQGIGLTTVGVATHFGAELATRISSVRGGNLFFFPDVTEMRRVFTEELDTMVTELAHNLRLVVRPRRGHRIAGVYGIPGEALRWGDDGSIHLEVATIFLSRRKGAIYVAFSSDTRAGLPENKAPFGGSVAAVDLSYERVSGGKRNSRVKLVLTGENKAGMGLKRGVKLVNQITALKAATRAHHENNDQEKAYQTVHALASIFRHDSDPELTSERELVFQLEQTLANLSGHHGEPQLSSSLDPVTGLPHPR